MKTFEDFVGTGERGTNDGPDGEIRDVLITPGDYRHIQAEAIRHSAELIHAMSRGTCSEDRAIAIDEARDMLFEEAANVAEHRRITTHADSPKQPLPCPHIRQQKWEASGERTCLDCGALLYA
jgi:hypothetical protein